MVALTKLQGYSKDPKERSIKGIQEKKHYDHTFNIMKKMLIDLQVSDYQKAKLLTMLLNCLKEGKI